MEYSESFQIHVNKCLEFNQFVGFGNPNAQVLIIGKEVATDTDSSDPLQIQNTESIKRNALEWKSNIENSLDEKSIPDWQFDESLELSDLRNNPLHAWKGSSRRKTSNTFKNYQKLHDHIFEPPKTSELNFQQIFFITEMNQSGSLTTSNAQSKSGFKNELEFRKSEILDSDFIRSFPVVVLACSNYIWNTEKEPQITKMFDVSYDKEHFISKQNRFWTHYSEDGKRLVIHTRQLSMAVLNKLIIDMGSLIKSHLELVNNR